MNADTSTSPNPSANGGCSCGACLRSRRLPRGLLLGLGLALIAGVWFFRAPLRQHIFADGVLANDEPTPDVVQTMIRQAPDPRAALLTAWDTGKIVQREVAIQELSSIVPDNQPLPVSLRDMLLAAALDPDLDVRESALNTLDYRHDPALPALLVAQLRNLDPQVQLLGLMHLKHVPAKIGVPLVVPLLNDNNPEIVAWALKLLEDWSDENFGVKLADAVPIEDPKTGLQVFRKESYDKTRAGTDRARTWWADHKMNFPAVDLKIPAAALAGLKPIYAEDFSLPDLNGRRVHLSDFRGKVVLINFWTTWCTACVGEIPELIALQKSHNHDLKILGVSLDAVPDDDSHSPLPPVDAIRRKVARTVKSRGINYTVLLDEKDVVGGRFNGGELPTTFIVDAQGRIRRRFIGPRSLPVFEAMIAEASKPMPPVQTDGPVATIDQGNSAAAMRTQLAR
jgi:cytochrome c biogenesis protein CcmG, thiol:disulfide interchange protein DsbE